MYLENFLEKFDEDDKFICYRSINPIKIFDCELDNCECEINISKELGEEDSILILTNYLEWLELCESEVRSYFVSKSGDNLPADWFQSIEVYSANITIITSEDFGATINFGESIFPDHIIELYFEKYGIVDDVLNG